MNPAESLRQSRPAPPFEDWPRQHHRPGVGFAWVTSPCVVVVQVLPERGSVETATWVQDVMDEVIAASPRVIEQAGGLLVVQDWRRIVGYETAARIEFMRRARSRPPGLFRRSAIVLSEQVSPLVPLAISAGAVFTSMFLGMPVSQYRDIHLALAEHQVEPPSATARFPSLPPDDAPASTSRLRRH